MRIRTHQKALNAYQYLPRHSFHPLWVLLGWVRGEAERYARTCTRREDFVEMLAVFKTRLLARGYSEGEIDEEFRKVDHGKRDALLDVWRKPPPLGDPIVDASKRSPGVPPDPLAFVTRWTPSWAVGNAPRRRVMSILTELMADLFPDWEDLRPVLAFKNSPNLRVLLREAASLQK